jgi:hypothetical protein
MSIIAKNLGKTTLSVATLAFTFGCMGCAHAKTTDSTVTQPASQSSSQGANSNQNTSNQVSTMPDEGGTPSAEDTQTRDMMKFSHNGHDAIIDIGAARLGLFDGHPKAAIQLMDKAQTAVDAAQREASDFKLPTNPNGAHTAGGKKMTSSQMNQGATMVPVDGRMSLGEDYVATPEKQSHIDKANQHFKNGETKQGMDELKLAGVDVNYTLVLMPIDSSKEELQQAISLANQGKYYEANLQLKKIEDNLVIAQESLVNAPQNGSKNGSKMEHNHTGSTGSK